MNIDSKLRELKGIGEKTEQQFEKLGVYTLWDILLHYPREYTRFPKIIAPRDAIDGKICAVQGRILKTPLVRNTGKMPVTVASAMEDGVFLNLTWFRMPYIKSTLKPGCSYIFYGKIVYKGNQPCIEQAVVYTKENYQEIEDKLFPVYPLVKGITNNLITKTVKQILSLDNIDRKSVV